MKKEYKSACDSIVNAIKTNKDFYTDWENISDCTAVRASRVLDTVEIEFHAEIADPTERVSIICDSHNADYESVWLDICDSVDLSYDCKTVGKSHQFASTEAVAHAINILDKEADRVMEEKYNRFIDMVEEAVKRQF